MRPSAHADQTTCLDPERMYSLSGFIKASGIAPTRRYHAAKLGIELPTLKVGRRKFVRGSDAIEYIEKLAEIEPTDVSAN